MTVSLAKHDQLSLDSLHLLISGVQLVATDAQVEDALYWAWENDIDRVVITSFQVLGALVSLIHTEDFGQCDVIRLDATQLVRDFARNGRLVLDFDHS